MGEASGLIYIAGALMMGLGALGQLLVLEIWAVSTWKVLLDSLS